LSAEYRSVTALGEGIVAVALIPSLIDIGFETPPGADRLVFKFRMRIRVDAPTDTTTLLEPDNGPGGAGHGPLRLLNELTHRGSAHFASTRPRTEGAALKIVPDISIFIRGDSNDDGRVDIADARFTLNRLFLGGPPPPCSDAADANDDGAINVSDASATLSALFVGDFSIPAPFPAAGSDRSADGLGPCRR
jgi:hypothetical protein